MRLRNEEIDQITLRIIQELMARGHIRTERESDVGALLAGTLRENLAAEERLNEEAYEILRSHAEDLAKGNIQHHEMFRLIKQKLAKERNFPL